MRDNQKEPKLTYAMNELGKMVSIESVENGQRCNCRCPGCNGTLIAKHGTGRRQPHFAHWKCPDCPGAYMSALHKLAEQIIDEEKAVMAPAYKEMKEQKLSFTSVEREQRVERKDLQPDVVGVTADGLRWHIEIRLTHEVDEAKKSKLLESKITCLEIDVREQTLEGLKPFLLDSADNREWINNPNYDSQIAAVRRNQISKIERLFEEKQELETPACNSYESKKIYVNNPTVLFRSDDGLSEIIKVEASDGIPCIFHIGVLAAQMIAEDKRKNMYNVLSITTDNLPLDASVEFSGLEKKWEFHYNSEKAKVAKIIEYKKKPEYKIVSKAYCERKCEYTPINGKCIYSVLGDLDEGLNVCNEEKRLKDKAEELKNETRKTNTNQITPKEDENFIEGITQPNNPFVGIDFSPQYVPSDVELPFPKSWTIEEYYELLKKEGHIDLDKNVRAKIVEYKKTSIGIFILCQELQRTITPYHVVKIIVDQGNLKRRELAVFRFLKKARDRYDEYIRAWTGPRLLF